MLKVVKSNALAFVLLLSIPAFAAQEFKQVPVVQASIASKLSTGIRRLAPFPTRASLLALKDRVATGATGLSCRILDTCRSFSFPSWRTIKDESNIAANATKQACYDAAQKAAEYGQIAMTFVRKHPRIAAASLATSLAFGFAAIKAVKKEYKDQMRYYVEPEPEQSELPQDPVEEPEF